MSITEAFIDGLFVELTGEQILTPTDFLNRVASQLEEAATRDWSSRKDSFKTLHQLSLQSCAAWQRVDAAIDARNSVAHGLGALTSRLRRKSNLVQNLRTIEATVGGGRIHLPDTSLKLVAEACRSLILELDARS